MEVHWVMEVVLIGSDEGGEDQGRINEGDEETREQQIEAILERVVDIYYKSLRWERWRETEELVELRCFFILMLRIEIFCDIFSFVDA